MRTGTDSGMRIRSDFISLPGESGPIHATVPARVGPPGRIARPCRHPPIVAGSKTLRWARSHFSHLRPGLHWFQCRLALRQTKRCDSPESWRSRS
ncbi:uncharacterized protein BCN122_II3157 [Burkholderia cenocepacia]|nr:uncharacterized protein BCN122_II3157 [Burkholderia cenocepacia]